MFNNISINTKSVLLLLVAVFFTVGGASIYRYNYFSNLLFTQEVEHAEYKQDTYARRFENLVKNLDSLSSIISEEEGINSNINRLLEYSDITGEVYLYTSELEIISGSATTATKISEENLPINNNAHFTNLDSSTISYISPVRSNTNLSFIEFRFIKQELIDVIKQGEPKENTLSEIAILDTIDNTNFEILGNVDENFLDSDCQTNSIKTVEDENNITNFSCINNRYIFTLTTDKTHYEELISLAFGNTSVYSVSSGIFFIIIFYALIRRILIKPLLELIAFTRYVANNKFDRRLNVNGDDEIGKLTESLNKMADDLEASYTDLQSEVDEKTKQLEKQLSTEESRNNQLNSVQSKIVGLVEDLQVEKEISIKANTELRRFKLAVDNAGEHIVIVNKEGIIVYANKAALDITKYEKSELIGSKPSETWGKRNGEFYETLLAYLEEKRKPIKAEIVNDSKNENSYVSSVYIAPLLDEQGKIEYYVDIEQNVTEIREIDKMKTEFISIVSHQLRTPLTSMKWYLELLANTNKENLNDKQLEIITYLNESNTRMTDLVTSLLNVSRLESGKLIIDPSECDVKEIIDNALVDLKSSIEEKKINIEKDFNEEIPLIFLDKQLIREVFMNLISNAVKYSELNDSITISSKLDDTFATFEVKDTGLGIPKTEQGKIFSKFFRATNAASSEKDGNGLGLYLVKKIVDESGGEIGFSSEEGKGSKFFVSLPLSGSKKKEGLVKIS